MDRAVLLDSAIPLYALGDLEPHRSACRAYIEQLTAGKGHAYASVQLVQELVFHRTRRTGERDRAVNEAKNLMGVTVILNFDREVLHLSLELIERVPTIRGRDAVHAATALASGIETIASTDAAFDGIPGIRRLDPLARS